MKIRLNLSAPTKKTKTGEVISHPALNLLENDTRSYPSTKMSVRGDLIADSASKLKGKESKRPEVLQGQQRYWCGIRWL
jgi:hypothetical protein